MAPLALMVWRVVWISPVSKNIEETTAYGDAYHGSRTYIPGSLLNAMFSVGYWVTDIGRLNDRFGTVDDLKALADELHRRNMSVQPGIPRLTLMLPGISWSTW